MKQRLLSVFAIAALSIGSVMAQSWTAPVEPKNPTQQLMELATPPEIDGNYFVMNVGEGQFLTGANVWATQISLSSDATPYMELTVKDNDSGYENTYFLVRPNDAKDKFYGDHGRENGYNPPAGRNKLFRAGDDGYVDYNGNAGSSPLWMFNLSENGYYYIQSSIDDGVFPNAADEYAGSTGAGKYVSFTKTIEDANIEWVFIPVASVPEDYATQAAVYAEDMQIYNARLALYELLNEAAKYEGVDYKSASDVYNNPESSLGEINAATEALKPVVAKAVVIAIIALESGSYVGSQSVEITSPTEGATIYYTLDGSDPTAESTAYTAPISIEASATLKAIAIKGENMSKVATATYKILEDISNTKETAKTVAEAMAMIDAKDAETLAHADNQFYVKGFIAQIDSYNETAKTITYWISDDGSTDNMLQCYSGKGLNGADFASKEDITVGVPVTVVGNLKMDNGTYQLAASNKLAAYVSKQDITITASDITDGDITAAYAAKKNAIGEAPVGNISITLDGATAYTVSSTIEAGGAITLAGNGATIDVSALESNLFAMAGAPTKWTAADVNISGVTIKGLKKALFYSTCQKYVANNFVIDNCVVELAADATTIDYTKGGTALNLTVMNSTFYATTKTNKSFYSSQGGQKAVDYASDAIQTFTFKNNTMYNLAPGKNFFSHRSSNQKWLTYDIENNIFVDCGKSGKTISGINGGQTGTNPTWIIMGNLFNYGGADTSASESTGDSEEPVQDSVAGIITFTDAAAGDMNATVVLAPTATQPEALGDARWTLAYATGLAINIATDIENGTIAVDKTYGAEGTEVTLTATPADGYEFGAYSVKDADDTEVEVTKDEETGNYTFVMPATAVTVSATFNELPHTVEMADDAGNWTIEPTSATSGTEIKATYKGRLKVKSVKAVKK